MFLVEPQVSFGLLVVVAVLILHQQERVVVL